MHSIYVDSDLWEVVRREAFERQCSQADVVNELLREALAAREQSQK